jgi:hypothetical protein
MACITTSRFLHGCARMDVSLDFLLIIGLSLVALGLFVVMLRAAGRPPFPRGPEGSFIVGNAFQMPKVRQWITFAEWGKIYGMSASFHTI